MNPTQTSPHPAPQGESEKWMIDAAKELVPMRYRHPGSFPISMPDTKAVEAERQRVATIIRKHHASALAHPAPDGRALERNIDPSDLAKMSPDTQAYFNWIEGRMKCRTKQPLAKCAWDAGIEWAKTHLAPPLAKAVYSYNPDTGELFKDQQCVGTLKMDDAYEVGQMLRAANKEQSRTKLYFELLQRWVETFRSSQVDAFKSVYEETDMILKEQGEMLPTPPTERPGEPEPCGDCDPCLGGRPDQCAISPPQPASAHEQGATPRTDKQEYRDYWNTTEYENIVNASFARQLELELAAAVKRAEEAEKELQVLRGADACAKMESMIITQILEGTYDGHQSDYETAVSEAVQETIATLRARLSRVASDIEATGAVE